jgi:hypothetical protein
MINGWTGPLNPISTHGPTDTQEPTDQFQNINSEFIQYFEKIGFTITWDCKGYQRWHEIMDGEKLLCQVDFGVPLADFLEDLPHFANGEPGTSATEYTASGTRKTLKAIYQRVLESNEKLR